MAFTLFPEKTVRDVVGHSGADSFANDSEKTWCEVLLNGIVDRCERFCGVRFVYSELVTEYLAPAGNRLYPHTLPIETITQVAYAQPLDDYGMPSEIIDVADYWVHPDGYVKKLVGCWKEELFQVTYSGGYAEYGSALPNEIPASLAKAMLMQFRFEFDAKNRMIVTERGVLAPVIDLLPGVKAELAPFRREF